ncbi:MAG: GerMN domain-containing protein [Bacilli bacterium]|nr:GerMN domain-containing protein [Bacilli bacterium]
MTAKRLYFIVITALLIILGIVLWSYFNRDEEVISNPKEIVPEVEIQDEQLRNTIVSLYFINEDTGDLAVETRLIDVKRLLTNPYEELINMWLSGSNNGKLKNYCTENVKLNGVKLVGGCAVVDLSENFIQEYSGDKDSEVKVIYCIVNTLTELTEVDSVKILIDGEENKYLGNFNLSEKYYRLNN